MGFIAGVGECEGKRAMLLEFINKLPTLYWRFAPTKGILILF